MTQIFYRLFVLFRFNLKDEVLSGLTVSLALVPEAVAFSLIAGVSPLVGLYTALANITTGFFGGMGGCAMLGQSLINVTAGGRTRISSGLAAIVLLLFILFFSTYIEMIPMAALVGLMFMVAIGTFEWASLKVFGKVPTHNMIVMVLVIAITVVFHNLAVAVLVGVIVAALVFAWQNAKMIRARKRMDENGIKHYDIYGPLFFASALAFGEKFDPLNDPDEIIIDFKESSVIDHSAIDAMYKVTERYDKLGKTVYIRHLNTSSRTLLENAEKIINVNFTDDDPSYKIVI